MSNSEKNQESNISFDFEEIQNEIQKIENESELFKFEKRYFSKEDGLITKALSSLGKIKPEERKIKGGELNLVKTKILELIEIQKKQIKLINLEKKLKSGKIDVSAPANQIFQKKNNGFIHPLTKTIHELNQILSSQNFTIFEGNDIEDDIYNFSYLNTDENHPARSMHDTIYIDEKTVSENVKNSGFFHSNNLLLRTHTSPGQIRISHKIIEHVKNQLQNDGNPEFVFEESVKNNIAFKFASIGKTYRNDYDSTHSPMFHQMEVVMISSRTTARDLMSMLAEILQKFFMDDSLEIRIRPSYFPFTQPSWEVDLFLKKKNAWVEVLGSGIVHPSVIKNMGLDPEFIKGYAFGAGIERLCMLKNEITDLREFCGHDLSWLEYQSKKINA
jgi:phenylalanyl-tRNA synthetase alpha chain